MNAPRSLCGSELNVPWNMGSDVLGLVRIWAIDKFEWFGVIVNENWSDRE